MTGFNRARDRLFDQLPRQPCLAEQPIREGEVARSAGAGVKAEPELGLAIAFGVEYPQRLLKMGAGRGEIALNEASHAQAAASGRRFRRPFLFLGFAHEDFGGFPRQPQLAAPQAADEQSVIGVEPLGHAVDLLGELPSAGEGGLCFLGAETSGQHQRLTVAGLQLEPALARRRGALHFAGFRERG